MTVYYKMQQILLENRQLFYYKMRQVYCYKMQQLLENVKCITNPDSDTGSKGKFLKYSLENLGKHRYAQ